VVDDQIGAEGAPEQRGFLLDYRPLQRKYRFVFESCEVSPGQYSSDKALAAIATLSPDAVLLDVKFGAEQDRLGFEILERVTPRYPDLPIIVMSSLERDVESLGRALELGAQLYIPKGPPPDDLAKAIERAVEMAQQDSILGQGQAIRSLRREIAKVSPYGDVPILVTGESGTGKELVARNIHHQGPRKDGPFVPVNCGALSESLLEDELFGHAKGAFTGASEERAGCLERAHKGVLFLDEIGNISKSTQERLLRVLDGREFFRLGGDRPIHSSFQVISATNAVPEQLVETSRWREDFYYRVAVVTIRTPPLSQRREDIEELIEHFLRKFNLMGQEKHLARDTARLLERYDWPGNVRELQNVVRRAIVASGTKPEITPELLPDSLRNRAVVGIELGGQDRDRTLARAPLDSADAANQLSRAQLEAIAEVAAAADQNAAAIMRQLFPGQAATKRYLGQVAWKLVDWNPRILSDPDLLGLLKGCSALWTAFTSYMEANPRARTKLFDKVRRSGVQLPNLT
jgi:DNA-binding NtrC family response regulator